MVVVVARAIEVAWIAIGFRRMVPVVDMRRDFAIAESLKFRGMAVVDANERGALVAHHQCRTRR